MQPIGQNRQSFIVTNAPSGALNLNVDGRLAVSPLQGFGQMWQKTYRIRLKDSPVQPSEVIKVWKENFPKFWPKGNNFYGPLTGIAPGEVAILNLSMPVGMKLSTGVVVLYADDKSFTLMTPQGHMFAGWITFSSYKEDDCTIAPAQVLIRANDPMYEIGFRLGGYAKEDRFWQATLLQLQHTLMSSTGANPKGSVLIRSYSGHRQRIYGTTQLYAPHCIL